jgi:signal transduction histidine kinase
MAGITHELKGPMASILAAAQLLEEEEFKDPAAKSLATKIVKAIERSQKTINNMLGFARKDAAARAPTDVAALLSRCVTLKRHDWVGGTVNVDEKYAAGLPTITASEAELEQVVFNLLQNAEQALRSVGRRGGSLVVRAAAAENGVVISIADDGPGIPAESLDKIWEPFFTTKQAGQGTGLGLAICREIVKAHSGTLTVDSMPGKTVFTIRLPA